MTDKKFPLTDSQVAQLAEQMAEKVKDSANQIWLAGLGAYSKAEEEGSKLFDALVQDGEKLEARTRALVDKPLAKARETVETVRARASGSWDKVEKAFDQRVSTALHHLNIPTRGDVEALQDRISQLTAELQRVAARVEQRKSARKKS